jgi:hypothetical protein
MWGVFKGGAYIRVGESSDMIMAHHHCLGQLNIVPGARKKVKLKKAGG